MDDNETLEAVRQSAMNLIIVFENNICNVVFSQTWKTTSTNLLTIYSVNQPCVVL